MPCDKPDCTHPHEMEIEYSEPKIPKASTTIVSSASPNQTVMLEPPVVETKTIEKIPSHLPKYKCKNCDTYHENKTFKRPKGKCENCGQFAQEDKGHCPTCAEGELEPIDDEELDDLGIPKSKEPIHEDE